MRPRALVALLLVLVVAGLTPLAKASPPDPTWVAGFWDNGDYDDVVLLICARRRRRDRREDRARRARQAAARRPRLRPLPRAAARLTAAPR